MPNFNDMFPSKYLKASDLKGTTPTLTISRVTEELVGQTKDRKFVCYFEGREKGLVCNKTNCKAISLIAGSEITEDWVGHHVQLFTMPTQTSDGTLTDGLRVRQPQRQRVVPAPPMRPVPVRPVAAEPAPYDAPDTAVGTMPTEDDVPF